MSGQWGYSLGIYKAGPEVLLLGLAGTAGRARVTGRQRRLEEVDGGEGAVCDVCNASKVLSSDIESEGFLALTLNLDLARPETRSGAEVKSISPRGKPLRALGWRRRER